MSRYNQRRGDGNNFSDNRYRDRPNHRYTNDYSNNNQDSTDSRRQSSGYQNYPSRGRGYQDDSRQRGNFRGSSRGGERYSRDNNSVRESRGRGYSNSQYQSQSKPQQSMVKFGPAKVYTNFYNLDKNSFKPIYMYSIKVEPELTIRRLDIELNSDLMEELKSHNPRIIYVSDTARILYSNYLDKSLENFIFEKEHKTRNGSIVYKYTLAYVKELNPISILSSNDREAATMLKAAMETIFKNSVKDTVQIGVGIYNPVNAKVDSCGIAEIWSGWKERIFNSFSCDHIYLNIDLTHTSIFPKGPLADLIKKELARNSEISCLLAPQSKRDFNRISDLIRGVEVRFKHVPMTKKIVGLVSTSAIKYEFEYEVNGQKCKTNVVEYFRKKYNINLTQPHSPLVQTAPAIKNVFVPMELLTVSKICRFRDDNPIIKNLIIKNAASYPNVRYSNTDKLINESFKNNNEILVKYGFELQRGMLIIDGTNMKAPAVIFGRKEKVDPANGQFTNGKDKLYFLPSQIKNLCAFNFTDIYENNIKDFIAGLKKFSTMHGMNINYASQQIRSFPSSVLYQEKELIKILSSANADMILLVCPDSLNSQSYGCLKSICDLIKGVVSQVVRQTNVFKCNPAVLNNILLKMNAKAGGVNHYAELTKELATQINTSNPLMVMGADVTHPLSRFKNLPNLSLSLAAVVSSIDEQSCKYISQIIVNERGRDIIDKMYEAIKVSLKRYKDVNGYLPKKIIMYRDGLSEGQFLEARFIELAEMRRGIAEIYPNKNQPAVTFICVQKRHHTRFYNGNGRDVENCSAGFFTDDERICEPNSFYLLSHKGIKGTSKASHYKIMHDESKFSLKQLIDFSFIMCHNYSRCLMSVSIPAPTYYAHHAAFRSHFHRLFQERNCLPLIDKIKKMNNKRVTKEEEEENILNYKRSLETSITPHNNIRNSMYFV